MNIKKACKKIENGWGLKLFVKEQKKKTKPVPKWDWYCSEKHDAETYFCYVNTSGQTINPGEQVYYHYGNRSNRFLLQNYGFCYADNIYDSYEFQLNLNSTNFKDLIVFTADKEMTQIIRLKMNQINKLLFTYLKLSGKNVLE